MSEAPRKGLRRHHGDSIWAYVVEILAAVLLSLILFMLFGTENTLAWVFSRKSEIRELMIAATSVAGVTFAAYFAVLGTEFGRRLRVAGAALEYAIALAIPLFAFFIVSISLTMTTQPTDATLLRLTTFLLIYSLLNCYTMIKNVVDLVGVWQDVERARQSGRS